MWSLTGYPVGARDAWGFSNVGADHTISVTFTPDVFILTATAYDNGSISPAGDTIVSKGGSQTYTITPDPGYTVAYVIVDGAYKGPITSFDFTNVRTNHVITAYFTVITHTITASAGPNGSISPSGSVSVANGGSRTFAITAAAGYHAADVLVDGSSVGAVASYTFTDVTAAHTISAMFAENTTFFITAPDDMEFDEMHGSISPAGAVPVLGGTDQTFTFTPDPDYRVLDVIVDGVSVGAKTTHTFTNVQSNHTISAAFTINVYTITATAGANGSISPAGLTTVQPGGSQAYSIEPVAGYEVENVVVDGVSRGAITTYTFASIAADHTISASFRVFVFGYMITASAGPNGGITPPGAVSVPAGSDQTFTISPATGYHVAEVLVDGASVGAVTSYNFTSVNAAHTISATFAQNTSFTITASAGPNGSISPAGVTVVSNNGSQTYTFTPLTEEYVLAYVIVDGMNIGAPTSYTFSNVSVNHVITAYFDVNPYWFGE